MKRKGFTLVELLVVIGIISMLVAILMPALRRAREQANRVACASNLHQVFLGFHYYAADFKANFPWPMYWYDYLGDRIGRPESTAVSTGFPRRPVLRCPSEDRSRVSGYDPSSVPDHTNYENDYVRCSYSMNWNIGRYSYAPIDGGTRKGFFGLTLNPGGVAEAPFITDAQLWGWPSSAQVFGWDLNDPLSVQSNWVPYLEHMFRHPNHSVNVLYLDGHVTSVQCVLFGGPPVYVPIFSDVSP